MSENRDYSSMQGEMLIRREEAKLERLKARAKALEENMEETIAGLMKKDHVKRALYRDAMAASEDPGRRNRLFDKAGNGIYTDDGEVITGREPRPWEN